MTPTFTQCLGCQGQVLEDRHGVFNLTLHTRGSMAGVIHVEGNVTANFVLSPLQRTQGGLHRQLPRA
jgi:hypothetical protein